MTQEEREDAVDEYNEELLEGEPPMTVEEMLEIVGILDGMRIISLGRMPDAAETCLMHRGE